MHPLITTAMAVVLTIGATARVVRLATVDEFPPIVAAKARLVTRYGMDHWSHTLVSCPWCAAPWLLLPAMASALLWHDDLWWRLAAAWLTGSYVVGAVVSRDA